MFLEICLMAVLSSFESDMFWRVLIALLIALPSMFVSAVLSVVSSDLRSSRFAVVSPSVFF
jgi:hypothetical protein